MLPTLQRPLPITISAEVELVSLATASAMTGLHADRVLERLDGEWPWAWDLTARHGRREIRIWRRMVQDPGSVRGWSTAEVVTAVIGTQTGDVRGAYLETRWGFSGQHFLRLMRQGLVAGRKQGHTRWLDRQSLGRWMEQRLMR
jgi:hypothetical protein